MGAVLLVDEAVVEGLLIISDGEGRALLGLACCGERGEELLHLLLVGRRVDVPDDDDALQVGAVPGLVEGLDVAILEGLQYVEAADDIAPSVLRAVVDDACDAVTEALVDAATLAPLLDDDTPLLLRILLGDGDSIAPVLEDEEHGVGEAALGGGDVEDAVAGVVRPCAGVEAIEAAGTEEVHHPSWEVLGGFEGHVLQVVS